MKMIIGIIVGIWLGLMCLAYLGIKQTCLTSYENYQPAFSLFGGCRLMVDGVLTPVDIVRNLQ